MPESYEILNLNSSRREFSPKDTDEKVSASMPSCLLIENLQASLTEINCFLIKRIKILSGAIEIKV